MMYLYTRYQHKIVKLGLGSFIFLNVMFIIGSDSRGGFVGLLALGAYFFWKSKRKLVVSLLIMVLRNTIGYTRSQADVFIVGRFFGTQSLGEYKVAQQFAIMPQTEVLGPTMQPLVAGLSTFKHDSKKLFAKFYQLLFLFWSFVLASALGLYFIADDFTVVVLGEKWEIAAPILANLGFLMLPFVTQPLLYNLYDILGKTKLSIFNDILALTTLLLVFVWVMPEDAVQFSAIRIEIGIFILLAMLFIAKINLGISLRAVATVGFWLSPSVISMALLLKTLLPVLSELTPAARMLLMVCMGASTYFIVALIQYLVLKKYFKNSFLYNLYPEIVVNMLQKLNAKLGF